MAKTADKEKTSQIISWQMFWSELWHFLKPFRKFFVFILIFIIISATLDIAAPYALKLIIDSLTNFDSASLSLLLEFIVFYFVLEEFGILSAYFKDRKVLRLLVELEYYLAIRSQEKLVALSLAYHERENTGSKIVKIERGINKISRFINDILWEVVPTIVRLLFTLLALLWVDWRIGLSFLIVAPLYIIVTYWANKQIYPLRQEIYKDYELASGKMGQAIININAVQSFVQEKHELSSFSKIKKRVRDREDRQWAWMMKVGLGRNSLTTIGRISVLLLGTYLVYQGRISIGSLIFAFTLSEKSYGSIFRLSRFYDRMEEGRVGVSRLLVLFKTESEIVNKTEAYHPQQIIGEIKFSHVHFHYKKNNAFAVQNLNFKIEPNCVTAFVGPSGGGKTTVARLIYRHYDPQSGQVLLDGRDLRDYDLASFRKFLAIVPQEVEIFDISIAENIAYARPQASQSEIVAAAKIANVAGFIDRLDKKYKTLVGERGVKLSGGERQRIGIARAVLAKPRVLIFDEATSNLDSRSELLIQDAIDKISRQRTMIIIAHRLSTIKRADKIIVLEKGRVVEEGNHQELAKRQGGLYARLLKLQALGELD